jgi:hypothetical protein
MQQLDPHAILGGREAKTETKFKLKGIQKPGGYRGPHK